MPDLVLQETETHTITITDAEQQAIIAANAAGDVIGIEQDIQTLIRSRQVDLAHPYYFTIDPFNLWRGDPVYNYGA